MSRAILKNTVWGLLGEMSARLSKIVLVVMMARFLGAAEIGQYNFALAQAGLFTVFFDFGVTTIAVREMARKNDAATFRLFGCVKLLGFFAGLLALVLGALAFDMPTHERILMVGLGLYLALNDLSTFVFAAYRAQGETWRETMWRTVFSLLQLAACVVALLLGHRVDGVAVALVVSTTLSIAPLVAQALKYRAGPGIPLLEAGRLLPALKQCLPIAGMVLVGTLYMNLDIVVLGRYVTKEEIGWYSIAVKAIFSLLIMPLYYFQLAMLPVLSAAMTGGNADAVRGQWLRGFVLTTTAGALLILCTATCAELILGLVFGPQFTAGTPILEAYGLIGFLYYLYTPLSQQLLLHDKQHLTLYVQIFSLMLNAGLIFWCIPRLGVWGAVIAAGATHALIAVLHFLAAWRVGGFTREDRGWWAIVRVSIGLAGAIASIEPSRNAALPTWLVAIGVFFLCAHREVLGLLQFIQIRAARKPALEPTLPQ